MSKILTFLLVLFVSVSVKAQSYGLKGILQNEDKKPLRSATVTVSVYNDSTIVFNTITDAKGAFEFKELPAKIYLLTATFVGYDSLTQTVTLTDSSHDLGVLKLYRNGKLLEAAIVERPPMGIKKDTTEYSASEFATKPNAVAEDLLKKLPGMT